VGLLKEVYLNDRHLDWDKAKDYFLEVSQWAANFCKTYCSYRVQDVTDVTYDYDQIACYYFHEKDSDEDILLFCLKWKNC
jgi:hypothetical protein